MAIEPTAPPVWNIVPIITAAVAVRPMPRAIVGSHVDSM